LNAGESRRLPLNAFWNRRIKIASQVPNGIEVYNIEGKCPPLTGHTVSFDQSWPITLSPDDYQFDYFYLNQGSTLRVTYQQSQGATNISILKGTSTLHALQKGDVIGSALLARYTCASQQAAFTYTAPDTDTYILLYDSASASLGKATVTIHIDLTTYDLEKEQPFAGCFALDCFVATKGGDCLLLEALPGTSEVTVHVTADCQWLIIGAFALLPLAVGVCLHLRRITTSAGDQPPVPEPLTTPTAPPEATSVDVVDYESIPIAAVEDIHPVAVPVGAKLTSYD
jgi:hypothetical protein